MNMPQLLSELGVRYVRQGEHHHARLGWIQCDCPFCGPHSDKFHLGYNLARGYFTCWRCGPHRQAETLAALADLSLQEARRLLRGITKRDEKERPVERAGTLKLPRGLGPLGAPHVHYLRARGFDVHELETLWRIQGIGIATRLSWRVFIPVYYAGEIVSWTTRSIDPEAEPRYISASRDEEAMNHKHLVYGEDYCRHAVVAVEGPISGWAVGPGAGALLGLGYTQAQVARLAKYPVRAVCFDNEPEAQKRALALASELAVLPGRTLNIVLDAPDPAEASRKEIKLLRRSMGL